MRKLLNFLFTRLNLTIVVIILQIGIFLSIMSWVFVRFPFLMTFFSAISILVFLDIVRKDKPSAYKLSWVIIVLTFLPIGGILCLLLGNKRPTKKIWNYMDEHNKIAPYLNDVPDIPEKGVMSEREQGLLKYIKKVSAYPAYNETSVKYYNFGQYLFKDMLDDLKNAENYIFLEYFIIYESNLWDDIVAILKERAASGIDVRLIIDDFGSMRLFTNRYIKNLRAAGIKVVRFNPLRPFLLLFMNNRDHRKITVIDGKVAYNTGTNIADEYINAKERFGIWKDTGVRLEGAAVSSFALMFIEMWDVFCQKTERINDYENYIVDHKQPTDGWVIPYGDNPLDNEQLGESVYVDLLNQATDYVYFFTPYLIISDPLIHALQAADLRGVDVRIVMPGIPDKKLVFQLSRSYYDVLLAAGVRIFEYTPGFMHGKSIVVDDKWAIVGTINLDYRSLYLHFECATLLYQNAAIADIKQDAIDTMAVSREILEEDRKLGFFRRLIDSILHLFAPLM